MIHSKNQCHGYPDQSPNGNSLKITNILFEILKIAVSRTVSFSTMMKKSLFCLMVTIRRSMFQIFFSFAFFNVIDMSVTFNVSDSTMQCGLSMTLNHLSPTSSCHQYVVNMSPACYHYRDGPRMIAIIFMMVTKYDCNHNLNVDLIWMQS